jgi:hypothetical protein
MKGITMRTEIRKCVIIGLAVAMSLAEAGLARQRQTTRRSQRVRMEQVQVAGPDGKVKLTILPNAERLTFTAELGGKTVLDPSTIVLVVPLGL